MAAAEFLAALAIITYSRKKQENMRKGDEMLTWKGFRVMSWVKVNLFVIVFADR